MRSPFARLVRSLLAGGVATFVDVAVLAIATSALRIPARPAGVVALLAGAAVAFWTQRTLAFRAVRPGTTGIQLARFVVAELLAVALNALFYDTVLRLHPSLEASCVAVRLVTSHLVFLFYSFPVWHWVFRPQLAPEER